MNIEDIMEYILNANVDRFNVYGTATKFDTSERSVREAFYRLRQKGIIAIRKDDFYILIHNENIEHYREEVNQLIKKQRKAAMTSITRYNKMIKSIPEEYQLWEEI